MSIRIANFYGPQSAPAGQNVPISVEVASDSYDNPATISITAVTVWSGQTLTVSPGYQDSISGGSVYFGTSFIMPNQTALVDFYLWYWNGSQWVQFGSSSRLSVSLQSVGPSHFSGLNSGFSARVS